MIEGIGRFTHTQHGFCIVSLCQGKIQDKDFYAFVAIEPQNYPYFKNKYQEGQATSFDVFGRELLRGWGTHPPEDIIDHVQNKHDIEFKVDKKFVDRLVGSAELAQHSSSFLEVSPLKPAKVS